jgi:hypothetical protein
MAVHGSTRPQPIAIKHVRISGGFVGNAHHSNAITAGKLVAQGAGATEARARAVSARNSSAVFGIVQFDNGNVRTRTLVRLNGISAFDAAVARAQLTKPSGAPTTTIRATDANPHDGVKLLAIFSAGFKSPIPVR